MRYGGSAAWTLLAGLVLATGARILGAQAPVPSAQEKRWVVVARELELEELVSGAATALDLAIDFNPAELTGSVSVRLPEKASAEELWEVASQALASRNLTSIQAPGSPFLTIVALDTKLAGGRCLAHVGKEGFA